MNISARRQRLTPGLTLSPPGRTGRSADSRTGVFPGNLLDGPGPETGAPGQYLEVSRQAPELILRLRVYALQCKV